MEEPYVFTRRWDDQMSMATALAVLAPSSMLEMRRAGLDLGIYHNFMVNFTNPQTHTEEPWYEKNNRKPFKELYAELLRTSPEFNEILGTCKSTVTVDSLAQIEGSSLSSLT